MLKQICIRGNIPMENKPKIKPKKRLGQNFLTQVSVVQKLAAAAEINPGQTILEIGPGTGILTQELLKTGNPVIAVEKDPEMVAILHDKFTGICVGLTHANLLEMIQGDALKFDETKIAPPYKIAANLPFYLTAPLIRKFLESQNPPLLLAVIVQKEVAQRICAAPPKMSLLAVSAQFYAQTKIIANVGRGNFWPAPKVDCAILQIIPFAKKGDKYKKTFINKFFAIAKAGFSHPRKQLINNLTNGLKLDRRQVDSWLTKNNVNPKQRPETLSVENWVGLAQTFPL
jgi:16S rRNA (adenine1518-N6/adenine1519-N6)-dimethyltransferase